jgi:adenine-specific DNA-methyltransferase
MSDNLTGLANAQERPNLHYDIVHPVTGQHYPPHPSRGWIYGPDKMHALIDADRLLWPRRATGRPRLKRYVTDMKSETTGFSTILDAPGNVSATKTLSDILGPKVFAFPKPEPLIRQLVEQATEQDSLVLDSFAGSGTTGHAVLSLNQQDGGPALTKCPRPLATSARGFSGAERPGRHRPSGPAGAVPVSRAERECDVFSRATVS